MSTNKYLDQLMELNQLEISSQTCDSNSQLEASSLPIISLETEIPEALYLGMKEFISSNPNWDQYNLISSALANFLFQNGCGDRAVTERYLNDLFTRAIS